MRSAKAKSLKADVKRFCRDNGSDFSRKVYRLVKKDYQNTPWNKRQWFSIG